MKTKITSKNKNVINIKINTEKKSKNKKRKQSKQSSSPKGKSSYNSGYSVAPPIIFNPFPQYNQPPQINNTTREPQTIQEPMQYIAQEPQPVRPIAPEPQPAQPFINQTNTTPATILQTIKIPKNTPIEKNEEFINSPSTHQVSFAKAMNAENDSDSDLELSTTNLDRTPKIYSPEGKNENSPSSLDELIKLKKKQEQSNVVNSYYHSLVDDFDRKNEEHKQKYNNLLEQYNVLVNPDGKPDAEFHDKPPSKERFKKLQTRVKNYYKKLEKESENKLGKSFKKVATTEKLI